MAGECDALAFGPGRAPRPEGQSRAHPTSPLWGVAALYPECVTKILDSLYGGLYRACSCSDASVLRPD